MGFTLEELMRGLPESGQLKMALHCANLGRPIWDEFAVDLKARSYHDGVVGVHHVISETLLWRAAVLGQNVLVSPNYCMAGEGSKVLADLKYEFIEPIVALQDDDWDLPEPVKLIFYAHSNLIEYLSGKKVFFDNESALYVSVNQSIDALEKSGKMTFEELRAVLQGFSGAQAPKE